MIILTHIPRNNYRQIHCVECKSSMWMLLIYIIRHFIILQNAWKWPKILQMRTVQQTTKAKRKKKSKQRSKENSFEMFYGD